MEGPVLIVDDDANLLLSLRRQFVGKFNLATAQGGPEAIELVRTAQDRNASFAVVVCDMRMPEMDGLQTLAHIHEISPQTILLMLTGNSDQQTTINAINSGHIFRFYNKPCPIPILESGISEAITKFKMLQAEHEILEKTLAGSIKVLIDLVSSTNPVISSHARRIRDYARKLTSDGQFPRHWQLEIASSLALIGQLSLPVELVQKRHAGQSMSVDEQSTLASAPEIARNLITNIPRLGKVAESIYLQDRGFDGSGFPDGGPVGADIPRDARILKVLKDLSEAVEEIGAPNEKSFAILEGKKAQYDPDIFDKIRKCLEVPLAEGQNSSDDDRIDRPVDENSESSLPIKNKAARNISGISSFPTTETARKATLSRKRRRHRIIAVIMASIFLAATGSIAILYDKRSSPPLNEVSASELILQMQMAAKGDVAAASNVYGGKLLVKDGNVQVDGIPRSACIQVSWKLIKTGMLSINGLVAQRVTGTSISKQCDSTNANVLAWSPYQANEKAEEE
ncbi:response regulator receiver protein [Paramagnetospirillum magnetotacticum MS-1]|uniref:Response regulator receiver protein n=2 Tax=Paramagnetospirillum magnetotacticum TaxID=188 RepID=A0A0C2YFI2_PARME|nr:response regulator receiver protein [Paramagnetospirillum magnetotacticum MS-1]